MLPLPCVRLLKFLHCRINTSCANLWLVLAASSAVASAVMLTAAGLAATL
jgi:hypothetical protein